MNTLETATVELNDGAMCGLSDGAKMDAKSSIIEYVDNAEDEKYHDYRLLNLEIMQEGLAYSKNNLESILKCFDENKSEVENMKDNGYLRIFDCGNMVFIKEYNNGIIKT